MRTNGMTRQLTEPQAEVEAVWEILCREGATRLRTARLDTWLRRNYGVAAAVFLTEAEATEAAGRLRAWLGHHRATRGAANA